MLSRELHKGGVAANFRQWVIRPVISYRVGFVCMLLGFWQLGFSSPSTSSVPQSESCRPCQTGKPNLFTKASHRLQQTWYEGKVELYLPGYAWHNRHFYTADRVKSYNENPWGGGLGKGFYDEDGDWHGLYAFAFLDSHKNVEPIVGYAFLKAWHLNQDFTLGGGYALLATMRPDINHGIPFPGALPWVSATYRRVSLVTIYIPGHQNVGNVLFLMAKVTL